MGMICRLIWTGSVYSRICWSCSRIAGHGHLDRLRRVRSLLATRGVDTSAVRLACFSGAGFSGDLRAAEARGEVILVDLPRLYEGE